MFAALLPVLAPIIERLIGLIPDENKRAEARELMQRDMMSAVNAVMLAQLEINKVEAASPSLFTSGWRPGAGWVCVLALAWQFVVAPLATWALQIAGYHMPPMPTFDDMLWQLMFGMLGMGALRSWDKRAGVDTKAVSLTGAPAVPQAPAWQGDNR